MPEGPSIILFKEEVIQFTGRKILSVSGNSKIDQSRILNQKVIAFKSWGKHFLICFKKFSLRIHFPHLDGKCTQDYVFPMKKGIQTPLRILFPVCRLADG